MFVHAYLKPKRVLSDSDLAIKEGAKSIVRRLNSGEEATMTAVHLAEVANLLEDNLPLQDALTITGALLSRESITIAPVTRQDCIAAQREAVEANVGLSDAIAYTIMKQRGLDEVYSFDRDFDRLRGIKRIRD